MTVKELEAWVLKPENSRHLKLRYILDELMLIQSLEKLKHNHLSMESFDATMAQTHRVEQALMTAGLVKGIWQNAHPGEALPKFYPTYTKEEIHKQWQVEMKKQREKNPAAMAGFDENIECQHDQELTQKINDSLGYAEKHIAQDKPQRPEMQKSRVDYELADRQYWIQHNLK